MQSAALPLPVSKKGLWAGHVLTALAVLFLLFDGVIHLMQIPPVVESAAQLGYPAGVFVPLGIIELACVALYLFPRTSVLGAVLLTGYLGGAIAIHVRVASPLFSHTLFPVYVALLLWGGLYLRDERLRALFPLRATATPPPNT
jgi:hypothetical protein